jgi:mannitol/fructose-specific phosphotransferase system IIA component (Ntr-type)
MQRKRIHVAIVMNAAGDWTGFITMEDIIEEIIGTVEDEFEPSTPLSLGDTLSEGRVVLDVEGVSLAAAIRSALARVPVDELGIDNETIIKAVLEREKVAGTYLGKGVALPHARIPNLPKPVLVFIRSDSGIPVEGIQERAQILFVLLTPAGQPRVHQRLQARIAGILENSDYVDERLRNAVTPAEVLEVIRTGEQASLD